MIDPYSLNSFKLLEGLPVPHRRQPITESAVREIWYLPQGSPPSDIRFLELNDRLTGSKSNSEPIDFGVDAEGAAFGLLGSRGPARCRVLQRRIRGHQKEGDT
jgi:hypothetical protein